MIGMKFTLTLDEVEKRFFEERLKELDKESKKPMSLSELDRINKHRATLIFVLTNLQKEEK